MQQPRRVLRVLVALTAVWIVIAAASWAMTARSDPKGGDPGEAVVTFISAVAPAILFFGGFYIVLRLIERARANNAAQAAARGGQSSSSAPRPRGGQSSSSAPRPRGGQPARRNLASAPRSTLFEAARPLILSVAGSRASDAPDGALTEQVVFDARPERGKPLRRLGMLLIVLGLLVGPHAALCRRGLPVSCPREAYDGLFAAVSAAPSGLQDFLVLAIAAAPGLIMLALSRTAQKPLPRTLSGR